MSLAAGARLNNRFTVRELIGTGTMSRVWRADDEVLGRPVAVKALTGTPATDPALRAATWSEARAAASLNHPNVTQVYDYGETSLPDGRLVPYLVTELLDGETLADRLRYGPMPWHQAAAVASRVASALAAAHRIGVVHRGVTPGNVMLTRSGVKVLDFGIGALAGGYPAPEPAYAAPATPAADVYALGALLYEALTGYPPAPAGGWDHAAAERFGSAPVHPPDAPGLPRQLRRLCAECLSPDPAERPTAEELENGLAAAAAAADVAFEAADVPAAPASAMVLTAPTMATGMPTGYRTPPSPGSDRTSPAGSRHHASPRGGPPTRVGSATGAAGPGQAALAWARRQPRWLVILLGAAIAVLLVALISLVTTSSRPNDLLPLAQPSSAAGPDTAAPLDASTTAEPSPSETTPSPVPIMTAPRSIADQLDAVVANAVAAGRIHRDAANKLREKIDELRASLGRNKAVRKAVRSLRQTIEQLRSDQEIDGQTANQLLALLQRIGGGGN